MRGVIRPEEEVGYTIDLATFPFVVRVLGMALSESPSKSCCQVGMLPHVPISIVMSCMCCFSG